MEKGTQFIQTFVEHIESDYKNRCLETMCVDIIAEVNQMIGDGKVRKLQSKSLNFDCSVLYVA